MSSVVPQFHAPPTTRRWRLAAALLTGAAMAGLTAGELVVGGRAPLVLALGLVFLPIIVWKRPSTAPVIVVASALTIEQFPEIVGSRRLDLTAHLPLFHGLGGYRPSDLLLLMLLCVYVAKRGSAAVVLAPRTELSRAMRWFMGAVIFGV